MLGQCNRDFSVVYVVLATPLSWPLSSNACLFAEMKGVRECSPKMKAANSQVVCCTQFAWELYLKALLVPTWNKAEADASLFCLKIVFLEHTSQNI